jgi:ubiquinone/menaquinone biosynthesis C-methylase UbiE
MTKPVYHSAVHSFLRFIGQYEQIAGEKIGRRILDVGAGGRRPPLGLFYEHGFDAWGIDISERQIELAKKFAQEHEMQINFSIGDMRNIPFEDNSFDIVYEFYAMCYLTKNDIRKAISEMKRVVKPGGLVFLGFISYDTWPIEGEERSPGEFWLFEHGDEEVVHSFYEDGEPERELSGLEILQRDRRIWTYQFWMNRRSKEEWMEEYKENWTKYTKEEWEKMYDERLSKQNHAHIFYILRK